MKNSNVTEKCIGNFGKFLKMQEKSLNTVEKYIRDVRAFAAFLDGSDMTKEAVINYKNRLCEEGYAVRSINSMIASLNSFFGFLGREELRARALKVQRRIYCPEKEELTQKEYKRLVLTAERTGKRRIALIIQTLCATGIRVSELQSITVEAARRREATVVCKGKTRTVFIVKELCAKLLSYAAREGIKGGCIFITRSEKPMSRICIWREMKALCRKAGVDPDKVYPHNLRHLFARVFYNMEKDIAKLADILGHSSINTTRIYITESGELHRRRMERMHLVI